MRAHYGQSDARTVKRSIRKFSLNAVINLNGKATANSSIFYKEQAFTFENGVRVRVSTNKLIVNKAYKAKCMWPQKHISYCEFLHFLNIIGCRMFTIMFYEPCENISQSKCYDDW